MNNRELTEIESQKLKCVIQNDNFKKLQYVVNNADFLNNLDYYMNNMDCTHCITCAENNYNLMNTIKKLGLFLSVSALSGITIISSILIKEAMKKK